MAEIKAKKVLFKNRDGEYLLPMTEDKTGLVLFDTILKDHVLTYEESKGLALQGTYVYKNAVAGERYGYPDFYNKCLEEYQNTVVDRVNATVVGSPTIKDGVVSGFSDSNYLVLNKIPTNITSFEIVMKVTTSSTIEERVILGQSGSNWKTPQLGIDSTLTFYYNTSVSGTSWDSNVPNSAFTPATNTTYWLKQVWTGSELQGYYSTNGVNYVLEGTLSMTSAPVWAQTMFIGSDSESSFWNGSIDLNECYININGERWWEGGLTFKNPNGHIFYDISQKELIDNMFTSTGMAWMYGIDQENERIFLPRNVWFEQMSMDDVGKAIEAGLPTHTHTRGTMDITGHTGHNAGTDAGKCPASGAFYENGTSTSVTGSGYHGHTNVKFQASRSWTGETSKPNNPIYGKSNTVQPNAVKKLLYICVGNTEAHRVITDVVDVTTTENDTIPLGYSTYQSSAQPSISWLKSEGQWNDGNAYITFYNWAVNRLGEAFASGYIKQVTETFDDYDLVINQDNMTFRLPLLDGSEDLLSNKYTDLTLGASGTTYTAPANGWFTISKAANATGQNIAIQNMSNYLRMQVSPNKSGAWGCVYCPVLKGQQVYVSYDLGGATQEFRFIYAEGNGSLYFKVANAVQNLQIIDTADLIENYTTKSMVDGQWVENRSILSEALAIGVYTLDLSDYLPNDGYIYEVWGQCYLSRGGDSGTNTNVYIRDGFGARDVIAQTMADGANFQQGTCQFLLTVDTQRTIQVEIANLAAAACNVYVYKYRRLGTNQ
jgi:hypothetical protein